MRKVKTMQLTHNESEVRGNLKPASFPVGGSPQYSTGKIAMKIIRLIYIIASRKTKINSLNWVLHFNLVCWLTLKYVPIK